MSLPVHFFMFLTCSVHVSHLFKIDKVMLLIRWTLSVRKCDAGGHMVYPPDTGNIPRTLFPLAALCRVLTLSICPSSQDQVHNMAVSQMGNYQDYLKRLPAPLREIETVPVRQHMFGNPFKIDKVRAETRWTGLVLRTVLWRTMRLLSRLGDGNSTG